MADQEALQRLRESFVPQEAQITHVAPGQMEDSAFAVKAGC